MPSSVRIWRETCLKAAEPSFPALSILPHLCLAKHRGVVIRIVPFFCGARRKAELLETSLNVDLGLGDHFIFLWAWNQPRDLRETLLCFTPWWYLPHRGRRKLRRLQINLQKQLGGSFYSLCFACCETGALKSWVSVSFCLTPAWKSGVSEVLRARREEPRQLLSLVTLNSSLFVAKLASLQMLVKVSTEGDYSRVLNLFSQRQIMPLIITVILPSLMTTALGINQWQANWHVGFGKHNRPWNLYHFFFLLPSLLT